MNTFQTFSAAVDAALLHRQAFSDIASSPNAAYQALLIPLLAGLSELAGQSVVLVSRRVRRGQAIASFVLTGLIHVCAVAIWTMAAIALLHARQLHAVSVLGILGVVCLGYAPRILSALTIVPYYGDLLGRALDAWSMACVGWGIWVTTGASVLDSTLCALLGWAAAHLMRRFGGRITTPALVHLGLATPGMAGA